MILICQSLNNGGVKMEKKEEDIKLKKYVLNLKKRGFTEKEIISKLKDEEKRKEFKYVKIANPFVLGIQIGIGIFILLPLFIIAILIILDILGVISWSWFL